MASHHAARPPPPSAAVLPRHFSAKRQHRPRGGDSHDHDDKDRFCVARPSDIMDHRSSSFKDDDGEGERNAPDAKDRLDLAEEVKHLRTKLKPVTLTVESSPVRLGHFESAESGVIGTATRRNFPARNACRIAPRKISVAIPLNGSLVKRFWPQALAARRRRNSLKSAERSRHLCWQPLGHRRGRRRKIAKLRPPDNDSWLDSTCAHERLSGSPAICPKRKLGPKVNHESINSVRFAIHQSSVVVGLTSSGRSS